MKRKIIDIIIPAYNAHNTLGKALSSIAIQTISNDIRVLLIDDYSKKDYSLIIKSFEGILDIEYIRHKENMGPGAARNTGLNNAQGKYIMFLDADDMFKDAWSIETLLKEIENNENYNAVYSSFLELKEDNSILGKINADHFTWILGCIFKRSFIERNHIRFLNASRGEDTNFNKKIKLLSTPEQIGFIDKSIYLWTDANAGGRFNTDEFIKITGRLGMVEGIIEVYHFIAEHKLFIPCTFDELKMDYLSNLMTVYFTCIEAENEEDGLSNKIIEIFKEYYKEYAPQFNSFITINDLNQSYQTNFNNKVSFPKNAMSFNQFIDKLSAGLAVPALVNFTYNKPLFSIIITFDENRKEIRQLLTSILSCGCPKDQIEVLICDNNIKDVSYIIDSFKDSINISYYKTKEEGFNNTCGDWIAFASSNDFFTYGSFIKIIDFIEQDKLKDVLFTKFYGYNKENKKSLNINFEQDNYSIGKFYNKTFLETNKIKFYSNELKFNNQIYVILNALGQDKPGYYDYKVYNKSVNNEINLNNNFNIKDYIDASYFFIQNYNKDKTQSFCLINLFIIMLRIYFLYQKDKKKLEEVIKFINIIRGLGFTNNMIISYVYQHSIYNEIRKNYNIIEDKSFKDFIVSI